MAEPLAQATSQAKTIRSGELSERALGIIMLAPMTLVLLLVVAGAGWGLLAQADDARTQPFFDALKVLP